MTHYSHDDLVLHFYGEAGPEHEVVIDEHLRGCPECQVAWTELTETLALVEAARVPEPDAGFEQRIWARVQQQLPETAAAAAATGRVLPFRLTRRAGVIGALVAAAAVVTLLVATGRFSPVDIPVVPSTASARVPLDP